MTRKAAAFARHARFLALIVLGVAGVSHVARAQADSGGGASPIEIAVTVTDTASTPIPNATITVQRDPNQVLATSVTNERGIATVVVRNTRGDVELIVRRLGYSPLVRFLTLGDSGRVQLTFTMDRRALALDPTVVTGRIDVKHRRTHVGMQDVARSPRYVGTAADVVRKLRPDMFRYNLCAPDRRQITWVNDERFLFRRGQVLRSVKAEHIAEIGFLDCFERSERKQDANSALYITLRPGVLFELGRGSFIDTTERALAEAVRWELVFRVTERNGKAISNAQISDLQRGTMSRTDQTGFVDLAFPGNGLWTLRIAAPGFQGRTVAVRTPPKSLTPIAVQLPRLDSAAGPRK